MSRLHRSNGVVANARDIQKKGGRNASPHNERREAFLKGHPVEDGHVVCPECYRVVRVRVTDGCYFSHAHCPVGGTPVPE